MTEQKDGPQHYGVQHLTENGWVDITTWEFYPRLLTKFLDYLFAFQDYRSVEAKSKARVVRVPYVWGNADYIFDGKTHHKPKTDEGYDPK